VKSSALWVDVNVSEDHAASIFRVKWVWLGSGNFPYSLHSEDGGSKVLRNFGILPQRYTASQTGGSRLVSLSPWKLVSYMSLQLQCATGLLDLLHSKPGSTMSKIT
jgi:hypothetical protein